MQKVLGLRGEKMWSDEKRLSIIEFWGSKLKEIDFHLCKAADYFDRNYLDLFIFHFSNFVSNFYLQNSQ